MQTAPSVDTRWWSVRCDVFDIPPLIAARTARSAIATLRRDIIDAERRNGRSHREAARTTRTRFLATSVGLA